MSTTTNKAICRRHYEEVLTGKRLDVVDEIYADPVGYGDGQSMPRSQFKTMAQASLTVEERVKVLEYALFRRCLQARRKGDPPNS